MQLVFGCVQLARRRTNYVSTLFGTNFLLDAINFLLDAINFLDFWEQLLTHQRRPVAVLMLVCSCTEDDAKMMQR